MARGECGTCGTVMSFRAEPVQLASDQIFSEPEQTLPLARRPGKKPLRFR
jgi:hypothetical protein